MRNNTETVQYFEQAANVYQKKLKLNEIHETLNSVFNVNFLQGSMGTLLVVSMKNGLKVEDERNEYMFMSQNAGESNNMKNISFEIAA
jgi:hypothetical protein